MERIFIEVDSIMGLSPTCTCLICKTEEGKVIHWMGRQVDPTLLEQAGEEMSEVGGKEI